MGYEAAKTLANEATAYGQQGKTVQALERFAKAREIFEREKNLVWPWLIDLYQALLLFHEGRYFEARRPLRRGRCFLRSVSALRESCLAHLLLARIALQVEILPQRKRRQTSPSLAETPSGAGSCLPGTLARGQIAQARNERTAAHQAYLEARKALEALRSGCKAKS